LQQLSLSSVDLMLKTDDHQNAALNELEKVAKDNSTMMATVCAGDSPLSVPTKIDAARKRLDAAAAGLRKIAPVAKKFYATLSDEQKAEANKLLDWPGL
jgi:hypothetical protein